MFDQLSAEIVPSLIKGVTTPKTIPTTTTTTKQNVDPSVNCVYWRINYRIVDGGHDQKVLIVFTYWYSIPTIFDVVKALVLRQEPNWHCLSACVPRIMAVMKCDGLKAALCQNSTF
jgi:hypothetical protein